MKNITKPLFDSLISIKSSFVIYFGAAWCMPCLKLKPLMEKLNTEYAGNPEIYYCDCDEEQELPGEFRVQAIPTTVFIKNGKEDDRLVGVNSEKKIRESL